MVVVSGHILNSQSLNIEFGSLTDAFTFCKKISDYLPCWLNVNDPDDPELFFTYGYEV